MVNPLQQYQKWVLENSIVKPVFDPFGLPGIAIREWRKRTSGEEKAEDHPEPPTPSFKVPKVDIPQIRRRFEFIYDRVGGFRRPFIIVDLPNIPEMILRRLPKEADGQSAYDTPAGKSISIQQSLTEREYGRLLHRPLTAKKVTVRQALPPDPDEKFDNLNREGLEQLSHWMLSQYTCEPPEVKINFWDCAALITPEYLRGFHGNIGFIYGIKSLHAWGEYYTQASLNAYQEISGLIPIDYEIINYNPELDYHYLENEQPLTNTSNLKLDRVMTLLGGSFWKEENYKFIPEEEMTTLAEELFLNEGEYQEKEINVDSVFDYIKYCLAAQYWKAGYQELPAELPESLLSYKDDNEPIKKNNYLDYFTWFIEQFDAIVGEFPIRITIEDDDPIQEGKQEKKIELPNLAEAVAEIYGLTRESTIDGELSVNFLARLAAEITAIKNGVAITQDYVRGNAAYLGYDGNTKKRKLNYNFNLVDPTNLAKILQEKEGYVVGWENQDKNTLADHLTHLQFAAGIIKSAFFRPASQADRLKKALEDIQNLSGEEQENKWEEFIRDLENPNSYFNNKSIPKPKTDKTL